MKRLLKPALSKRAEVKGLLKKTMLGSLVGVTLLGTLPGTIGVTSAEPQEVQRPLVLKGGWQPALKEISVWNSTQPINLDKPRGLIAVSTPNEFEDTLSSTLLLSNFSNPSLVFGNQQMNQEYIFNQLYAFTNPNAGLVIKDLTIEPFAHVESTPPLYGTGQELNGSTVSGQSNVYRLFVDSMGVTSMPLLSADAIPDAEGIDYDPVSEALYVAGGSDKTIWKVTENFNRLANEDSVLDSNSTTPESDELNPADSENNDPNPSNEEADTNNEIHTNSTDVHIMTPVQYTAEPVFTFETGSDVSDVEVVNNEVYVADKGLNRVVKFDLSDPTKSETIASNLSRPESIAVDNNQNVYIADTGNHQLKKYEASTKTVSVVAGTDKQREGERYEGVPAVQATLSEPTSVAVDQTTNKVYFTDSSRVQTLEDQFFYKQERDQEGAVWNLVENAEGLDHMRDNLSGNYRLTTDISFEKSNSFWTAIGPNGELPFTGNFDGAGHTINGLTISAEFEESYRSGLFGYLSKATVKNVRLKNIDYTNSGNIGGVAAYARNSTIEKVSVEGQIRSQGNGSVGGLIGQAVDTSINQSYFNGKLESGGAIGGLVGSMDILRVVNAQTIQNSYAWSEITDNSYLLRRSGGMTGGIVGVYNYEYDSSANVIQIPITFKNTYASTEFKGQLPSLVPSSGALLGGPFEGDAFDMPEMQGKTSSYWDGTFPSTEISKFAKKLTTEQMKTKSSFEGWDFDQIWTLETKDAKRGGYPTLKAFAKEQVTPAPTPTPVPTPVPAPTTGGGTSAPISTPAPTNTTTINVNVQNNTANNGSVVASLAITRTKGADGSLKDQLQFTPAKAKEIIDLLKTSGSKTAAIVLPDAADEVSEWSVNVPKDASNTLTSEGVELVILNPNVNIKVPASSLTDLTDDLYFRLTPVKSTATSTEIQNRALSNPQIVASANGGNITVAGRPMTIETNLQSRPVTLTLPLAQIGILTAAQQRKLGVYIEHSDGTKELVRGTVVTQADGKLGLEITVNHFSTFTVVDVEKWGGSLNASPYIMGYADGSFKPAQAITRAELAAIVGRITGVTQGNATFSDVKNGSWAASVVGPVAASGIMTGYNDGTFKPNASITRGELAAALAKLLPQSGLEMSGSSTGFSDLAANHWVTEAAKQLQAAGVVTGYANGSFKPEQNVTRAEAVTMINRLVGLANSNATSGTWSDVASGYWAYDAVRAASMQR
ncbi:S-layer homology domain-containing protein [Saccharibacillus sp. JS10]|uniref:S-layer homology domain-containing protein n=1 Tax=Saccharibacillus sp. JS10 TaxID=2950552 RepID=UPI002109B500|nr:S-layer homology domain-containing protein [Saccharibacillus sp. JS10]MCQ4086379.1 S-layer homology domain-containing protein [Saccharibacillus sp. JS10]